MAKFNLKDQLAGIAALIAAIVAIGGGFVKYGEITTKLNTLSEQSGPDLTPLAAQIGNNQKMISENINGISENAKSSAVLQKEIELLKLQIEEIKVNTSNPLSTQ
jgi:cell shape-determining protein MreC